jgi:hypothetical protein
MIATFAVIFSVILYAHLIKALKEAKRKAATRKEAK